MKRLLIYVGILLLAQIFLFSNPASSKKRVKFSQLSPSETNLKGINNIAIIDMSDNPNDKIGSTLNGYLSDNRYLSDNGIQVLNNVWVENQIEGAEGIKITNSRNIILKDFTIENSKGDLIKVEDTNGIEFINVKAQWTYGPLETNGSYALYPVKSKNVLVDNCIAIGASDAGIYVGQSENILVRNSEAYHNVASNPQ